MNALDWRTLPLTGTSLVEASAGTGKTWNVAMVYLRLVLETGLKPREIVVATFTDAAAQELRGRIRQRLIEAERELCTTPDRSTEIGSFLATVGAHVGVVQALARLRIAIGEIDTAPISTIHGFCKRVLGDYPFDTGVPFSQGEVVDEHGLLVECMQDFWRARFLGEDPPADSLTARAKLGRQPIRALATILADIRNAPGATVLRPSLPELLPAWLVNAQTATELRALASDKSLFGPRKSALSNRLKTLADQIEAVVDGSSTDCLMDLKSLADHCRSPTLLEQENPNRPGVLTGNPLIARIAKWADERPSPEWVAIGELIEAAHAFATAEIPRRLLARNQTTFTRLIADVHERLCGEDGESLAARLRTALPVALIDEFQDTDGRQWEIFRRIWARADDPRCALVLIGDPKQSIYAFRGADIHAYLTARDQLPAQRRYAIQRNFRAHPRLLAALNGLYAMAGAAAFGGVDIEYLPVAPGDPHRWPDPDSGQPLCLRLLESEPNDELALATCADDIAALLNDPNGGVQAGDVAVLLNTNRQVADLRAMLQQRRVPVVGAGRSSVLATEWADDVQLLLYALLHPNDEYAARGALATRLLGCSAADLVRLAADAQAWEEKHDELLRWRRFWNERGVLAMLEDVILGQASRLLAGADGERSMTDLRHLAEVLQEAAADCYGPLELYQWFVRERDAETAGEDARNERQLRIESESRCVQLMTLHASKGLQFPVVFVPMAWRGKNPWNDDPRRFLARFHDPQDGLCINLAGMHFAAHKASELREGLQERLRTLYVALTRAERMCQIYAFGPLEPQPELGANHRGSLEVLLGAALARVEGESWQALAAAVPGMRIDQRSSRFTALERAATPARIRAARGPLPSVRVDFRLHSYTSLTRRIEDNATETPRHAEDESDTGPQPEPFDIAPPASPDPRIAALDKLRGARFGDAIHKLLERDRVTDAATSASRYADQTERIRAALQAEGIDLDPTADDAQLAAVGELLDRTLDTELVPGLRLAGLRGHRRRAEFEFSLPLERAHWGGLHRLLDRHGLGAWWPAAAGRAPLRGLLNGFVDLVFEWRGRVHILDYKTNWLGAGRLSDYARPVLDGAMREHRYGLQALIYTVAVHRYLGQRIDGYDPERHLGDSWYLFVRALGLAPGIGLWRQRFPHTLIEGLDALLDGAEESA
ncbi:MAG: UvrD-helicase domain-containing protein [Xanthomonadales bacterium]|nr:RecBCD enzyme subunit RecB [Xanthomonadales bacterium]MCC6593053.1 UvrD-helicase domain-containing protein [Xanthomonadales bacterium]